ncbi:hypothetical protein NBRC110019_08810 [Neptunitalea chrysea]|uniref:Uncharacterized protein n=1 Tax=Neptunitalea chrysea TaxID=1647581 RepID=A0A9W6B4S2_9FLAO|nr:hypothetical protein [Neptunitalea chrysea]GLB51842.1 hypothetical protein NBRC110019_08810 [Neptunitalea chrysea]
MLKKLCVAAIIFVTTTAFTTNTTVNHQPKKGDVYVINTPKGNEFHTIDFPKLNTLIKRGTVANYKSVYNTPIVITEVGKNNEVTIARKDGKKFFRFYKTVTVDLNKALESGELSLVN